MKTNSFVKSLGILGTSTLLALSAADAKPDEKNDKDAPSSQKSDRHDEKKDDKAGKKDPAPGKQDNVNDGERDKQDRKDQRHDRKEDRQADARQDRRQERVEDRHADVRQEQRQERVEDRHADARQDQRQERAEDRHADTRQDQRQERAEDRQADARHDDRPDPKRRGEFKGHFEGRDRDHVVTYFSQFKGNNHGLPPGLAKRWDGGRRLPSGWRDRLVTGYVIEDDWYPALEPVPYTWFPEIAVVPDTRLYWYGDRVVRVYEPTHEVVDVVVIPTIHIDL